LTCFMLPGGFLLIPLLAAHLDRRKSRRMPKESEVKKLGS
jgi:hypothetical protein